MSKYYQENFESYLESYKEEVNAQAELMNIIDTAVIRRGLPPVGRTKELFSMMETIRYDADSRYRKKNNIVEDGYDAFTYLKKDDLLNEMRSILREEVANFFSQDKSNDWT